jgi:NDP-sugar pyrophosphorylase family protein
VLLAAGESSRFWPLSTHGHKSLHRLCGQAIIEHTVRSLAKAGFTDIVVVQSPHARNERFPHRSVADQLGDGSRYGVTLKFVEQPEPLGQGDAILLAEPQISGDECFVVQPENVNAGEILAELAEVPGDVLAVQERDETWLFGVCAVEGDKVTAIVEKPEAGQEPSKLCSMGVAKLTRAYLERLQKLPVDPLSNLQALEEIAAEGELRCVVSQQPFFPLKYPWHLFAIAEYLKPEGRPYIGENVAIDPEAEISPGCVIETDTVIGPGVTLSNVLAGAGSNIHSSAADSILGAAVRLGPEVSIETKPVSEGHVRVDVKGHEIDTALPALGTTIGQGAEIERGSVISAGVLIGAEARIPEDSAVTENWPDQATDVEAGS